MVTFPSTNFGGMIYGNHPWIIKYEAPRYLEKNEGPL